MKFTIVKGYYLSKELFIETFQLQFTLEISRKTGKTLGLIG